MNIINIIGMCSSPSLCVILEFAANGDLYCKLHKNQNINNNNTNNALLPRQRLSIAKDIARGIWYLHSFAKVMHRDIKSQNILVSLLYTTIPIPSTSLLVYAFSLQYLSINM